MDPELYDSQDEAQFAYEMHQRKLVWTPRHMVAGHRLDYAFVPEKLDVELDGATYHAYPNQQRRDDARDAKLNRAGWIVLRVSAYDAKFKTHDSIQKIQKALVQLCPKDKQPSIKVSHEVAI